MSDIFLNNFNLIIFFRYIMIDLFAALIVLLINRILMTVYFILNEGW